MFDRASLAAAENSDGTALYATDFQSDPSGFVRILIADRGLGPERAGALTQRVLEIETYRTLALLGLPEAQRLAPAVRPHRDAACRSHGRDALAEGLEANQHLLEQLTALAAELEAGAAASQFRFGASRAYDQILHLRLQTIGERKSGGLPTWTSFLARRMAPAIRTCATLEERQANLAEKLARAANLLRTRVDVELESQNRDVLRSMNERTRLQLMLQATVEGLSVAAISYYVVGLFGYLVKGAHDAGLIRVDPSLATGVFVPVAVALVWWIVRRIRKRHIKAWGEGLHRRRDTAPDIHRRRGQRAVRLLLHPENDDLCAGLELAPVARLKGDDRGVRRHDHLLLLGLVGRLVFHRQHLPIDARGRRLDRRIGHRRARPQIPRPMPFAGPALRLGEDVDRDRLLAAVGLRHRGHADVGIRLDVGERSLEQARHAHVVRHIDGQHRTVARLHGQRVALDLLDLPTHPHRRGRLLRQRSSGKREDASPQSVRSASLCVSWRFSLLRRLRRPDLITPGALGKFPKVKIGAETRGSVVGKLRTGVRARPC